MTGGDQGTELLAALHTLRDTAGVTSLPLDIPGVERARRGQREMLAQLDDYIIPRVSSLDAPLLAVVGGSTGAGKSTLVNSVVGETVTRSGVLRPTTRGSTLIHNPADARWFTGTRVLPGLARQTGTTAPANDPDTLRLVSCNAVPVGIALLDAPDIDSVVSANRDLARQLLSAADLWIFVTTASRYADAVPWELLHQAIGRGTSVAVVLNRVPMDAMQEVRADLAGMLMEQGLGQSPVFAIAETSLSRDGLLPVTEMGRVRSWLRSLASDAHARGLVIRRTLDGALDSLAARTAELRAAHEAQVRGAGDLTGQAAAAYDRAVGGVQEGMRDGSLLRGEVLARWQEFVGTGELLRQLDAGVGRMRDRVTAFISGRGKAQPADDLGHALQTGVAALLQAHAESAAIAVSRGWRNTPGGAPLVDAHRELASVSPDFTQKAEKLVRSWQDDVLQMVREEAGGKRATARFLAFGVNGIAVMLMLLVFSATAGLSGAEIGIAGGSAILAQRLLEAVFGDQAVRTLSARARTRLLELTTELYDGERQRFDDVLDEAVGGQDGLGSGALDAAVSAIEQAR
ncbi:GTPase domain-containing protein [Leekyejoonella antrihumi]|uniref:GTPase domain-containing protein n=1 Tax=Leekyejoonella antrihumi TaxID=1660198 RepID=UPI001FEB4BDD|nr:GTPase domain-containing protein [Leekyejoonella antrihumi]